MLTLTQIDLLELGTLLDGGDDPSGYFDPDTGETYPVIDGQVVGLGDNDGDYPDEYSAAVDDMVPLGGDGGHDVYRDMELFTEWVGDGRVRYELSRALEGSSPMREFRRVVHSTPERIGRHYSAFSDIRSQLRAVDFLMGRDVVSISELEERRAQLIDAGDTLLESLGGGATARLILLDGMPGVGKSTIAKAYVADRPGTLNLDIDVLRTLVGGEWSQTAELGRSLALTIAQTHLASGYDVVVPQLVADPAELARFESAAKDFAFMLVMVRGEPRAGDEAWRASVSAGELEAYAEGLDRIARKRRDIRRLDVIAGDVDATVAELGSLLGDRREDS